MKKMIAVFGLGILVGGAAATGAYSFAGSASATEKNSSRVVFENEDVLVKEAVFVPGDTKPGMHTHKYAHVGVVIDGGTLKFNYPDGKTETLNLERGGAGYREANVTHEAVNVGSGPVRVIEVEIKK